LNLAQFLQDLIASLGRREEGVVIADSNNAGYGDDRSKVFVEGVGVRMPDKKP